MRETVTEIQSVVIERAVVSHRLLMQAMPISEKIKEVQP